MRRASSPGALFQGLLALTTTARRKAGRQGVSGFCLTPASREHGNTHRERSSALVGWTLAEPCCEAWSSAADTHTHTHTHSRHVAVVACVCAPGLIGLGQVSRLASHLDELPWFHWLYLLESSVAF
ncbi:hypothetical protein B0T26DRAFT_75951 [Lasiosphaeria miniovina]|uniref:Uncharacterized protein n=1 Tax=Lasiosphaeria miniovina TaxID=1954250 RepID=A0AA40EAM3_9PEZI|nr:uncharacterized protein B0T26DRAFT_75951 [Lasiosphaeria miniovina]KAK0734569.1 hypothetical protein B0T26DRAFT_75951 [Lasiosphaeria miniovina]